MKRNILFPILILVVIAAVLAGCAGVQLPWAQNSPGQGQQNPTDFTNQPVENKLAIGTLMLEDSSDAITAEQARKLLPLWKAVRGLGRDTKTTTKEMDGLYRQILTTMTLEQVKAIQDMTLEQDDLQAILQQYGAQMPRGGAPNPGSAQSTPAAGGSQRQQFQGGGPMGGGFPGGGQGDRQNSGAQVTPQAGAVRAGLNGMLVEPVIRLLEKRAGE